MKLPELRWSLRTRLTALAIGASCITAAIGAAAIVSNTRVADAMGFMQEQRVKPLVQLDIVGRRLERQRGSVLATLAATNDVMQQDLEKQSEKDAKEIPAVMKALRDAESNVQQKAVLARLAAAIDKSRDDGLAAVLDKLRKGQFVEADVASQLSYRPQVEAAARLLDEVVRAQVDLADRDYRDALGVMRWQAGFTLAMVILALVAGCGLAAIVSRAVQRALGAHEQDLAQGARRVANGSLGERIVVKEGDTESVAASLNAMSEEFSILVREVVSSTEAVARTAVQLSGDSRDLSMRTAGQAASLEETAASTQQLSTTVLQNAQRAEKARGLAHQASELAAAGGKAMAGVEATMKDIADSSRRVAEIASVIDGIALQTNILALNAAVEAARAGEEGRGFAVVAAEVRSLSQRSAAASREIRGLIEEAVKRTRLGLQGVEEAAKTIRSIVEASHGVSGTVSEIAAASREQSAGIQQVNDALEQLESVTQSNAALSERAARDAHDMSEQAASLVAAVSHFSLGDVEREAAEVISRASSENALAIITA